MSKRILAIILLLVVILPGCRAEEVSNVPIDTDFREAYDAQEVEYGYVYDWLNGEIRYMPTGTKLVHHDAVYRVKYRTTYADGYVNEYWETVTEEEYREAVKQMEEADNEQSN
jgi:hypothetical protein